ncbi:MAG: peptidylprolyl isomerase [Planctomycetota bacterium]
MFSYKSLIYTFTALLMAAVIYWHIAERGAAADGEEKANEKKPPTPRDADAILRGIPRAPLEDGVVLQAGEIKVSLTDVEKHEKALLAASKRRDPELKTTPAWQMNLRKNVAFRLLHNALADKYVKDNKLSVTKERVAQQFEKFQNDIARQGASHEQFLTDNGISAEEFHRVLTASCAIEVKVAEGVKEEDIIKTFEQHKGKVDQIEKEDPDQLPLRHVLHILFMYKGAQRAPEMITRTKEEAKSAANEILKKLKAGEDFVKMAQANSDCPSKAQGGDLDYFPRKGAMTEPFSVAAYKLEKIGDYTDVVETEFGFHIIKMIGLRTPASMKAEMLVRLKSDVKDYLTGEKMNQLIQQLLEEAVTTAKFNEKLVLDVPQDPPKGLNVIPKTE